MRAAFLRTRFGRTLSDFAHSPEARMALKFTFAGVLGTYWLRKLSENPASKDVDFKL